MKKNLILFSCLALLSVACKKNHDSSNPISTWTFKGTPYQAIDVTYMIGGSTASLTATAIAAGPTGSRDILVFEFTPPPTISGEMLITDSGDPNTIVVSVADLTTVPANYVSGKTNVKANVTVNGKVSVSFPGSIWLYNNIDSSDSAQLSVGTITQQ